MNQQRITGTIAGQTGVSLIEVMVAILVMGVGMLGVAAMQTMALRNNQSAVERSAAVTESYAMLDALRADRSHAVVGDYDVTEWACDLPDAGSLVNNELRNWISNTQQALGAGACVKLACDTASCTVQVRWDDSRGTAGSDAQEVVTVSQI